MDTEHDDKKILEAYFALENALYKDNNLSIETKAAEAWGVLTMACQYGEISWDNQRKLFGELMANLLNVKIRNYSY